MGDSVASEVATTDEVARMESTSTNTVTKTVHETEGLCIVGARVVSESGKVESSVELPMVTASSPTPETSSTYSSSQVAAHTATPEKEEHTVTSYEAGHTKTSMESVVRLEPLLEGGSVQGSGQGHQEGLQSTIQSHAAQTVSQTKSSQSSTQSSEVTESASQDITQSQVTQGSSEILASQSISQSEVSEAATPPLVTQPVTQAQVVDENANIQHQQQQQAAPPSQPRPEVPVETKPVVEPAPVAEAPPVVEAVPVVAPEPTAEPEPLAESNPAAQSEVAPVVESLPAVESQPVVEPQPAAEQPQVVEPAPVVDPEPVIEPDAVQPEPAVVEPVPVTESEQTVESAPAVAPEPVVVETQPALEHESPVAPEHAESHEPLEAVCEGSGGAEITQENIRTQLHEIITEIEQTVLPEQQQQQQEQQEVQEGGAGEEQPVEEVMEGGRAMEEVEYYDEDGILHHTWRPKGNYAIKRTPIKYEDVIPIAVPDVKFTEKEVPKPEPPPPQPQPEPEPRPQPSVDVNSAMTNGGLSPVQLSPIEIPEGIPLLARILPKDDAREDGSKISLERLFTPATDSGDLTPKKKKAYASSAFYRPDHPTIDDQVELAQRISFSLVDENNKLSRGQSMYMKRKKRASRWIHQGGGSGTEGQEDESPPHAPTVPRPASMPPLNDADAKKPAMKLLMNPKGVQDFHAVQQHYQTLMESAVPTSPEVNKIVTEVQSPTGKGAELFAKRKKRMDKFIVDETTVQKAQQQSTVTQQTITTSTSATDTFAAKKQAEMERKKQQDQIMEQFLKNRESVITMVKSPWKAALETGCAAAAFEDNRYKAQLANTVCERADSKSASWLEMPKAVPVNAPPIDSTPSGPADFYTAEVKVVQRASLPSTPVAEIPHHSLHDLVSEDKLDKRRSSSFNMAAKGWGTYNNFYTPITFATS